MKVVFFVNDYHACGSVRGDVPARSLQRDYNHHVYCKDRMHVSDYVNTDVIVFQRTGDPSHSCCLNMAKDFGVRTIYDIDDDLFNVPSCIKEPHDYYSREDVRETVKLYMRSVDLVTVSCEEMMEWAKLYTDKPIMIVPNAIDMGHSDLCLAEKSEGVIVGWHGSGVHRPDAKLIGSAVKEILERHDNVNLVTYGEIHPEDFMVDLPEDRVLCEGWLTPSNLYYYLSKADVAMCPITPSKFNDKKSNIKWLEYASVKVPCVLTDTKAYDCVSHDVDGYKVKGNDPAEWFRYLDILVSKVEDRQRIGSAARDRVRKEFSLEAVTPKWIEAFEFVRGT